MTFTLDKIVGLSRTKKLLILAGTDIVLFALYLWLLVVPLEQQIGSLTKKLDRLQNQMGEQKAIAENLEAFKAEYLRLQETLTQAMTQLPNSKEIPSLLENISNLGRDCGLELPLFKPDKEVPKDFYAEVPVDIKIVGTYPNLVTFFCRIGMLPRIVTISNMEIATPKDQTDGTLSVACRATTYRFLEANERQAAAKSDKRHSPKEGGEGTGSKSPPGEQGAQ